MLDDTIAAISTPIGTAGIAIIRISGDKAVDVAKAVFINKKGNKTFQFKPSQLHYGYVINKDTGEKIDEVLISYMKGPRSFTAEDVIEINCHGGLLSTRRVLEAVLKAGARLAEPGEFTKRAFLNGRIDLAQAESVIDIINAKTAGGLALALKQLEGRLTEKLMQVNQKILELMAYIEAGIDFPEDDIEELSVKEIRKRSVEILSEIEKMLKTAETGKIYRDGISTVIVGKPNVGKSSLLNALLNEKRAIVTDVPGTTRDIIEEYVNIKGIPLKVIDTAGIRETEDLVEKIGVEKAKETTRDADLILFVIDAVQGMSEDDFLVLNMLQDKKAIVIINKVDIKQPDLKNLANHLKDMPVVEISAKKGFGIEELEEKISELVLSGQIQNSDEALVSNVRHQNALERAAAHIRDVIATIDLSMPTDCMAIDLKGAWECLGEISGETLNEDVIDKIFSEFCIGK